MQRRKKYSRYLKVENLSFDYHNSKKLRTKALDKISFIVKKGEFITIVGPSGCGKTTLLYCLGGLLKPTKGEILIQNKKITKPGKDRSVVFQDSLLLPWRTVSKNIAFGIEMQKLPKEEIVARVNRFIELTRLEGFENHYPHQLSGGMKQRVNLARALAFDPEILLLDEPFSHLDAQSRELMQKELLDIYEKTGKTFILVTHHIDEAIFLADKVIVLGKRPGWVKKIIKIDFLRPRKLTLKNTPSFLKEKKQIWNLLFDSNE